MPYAICIMQDLAGALAIKHLLRSGDNSVLCGLKSVLVSEILQYHPLYRV